MNISNRAIMAMIGAALLPATGMGALTGNGNLWVSFSNSGNATAELREYSVAPSGATLLQTYTPGVIFADLQYTEALGGNYLVGVAGDNTLYLIDVATGAVTTRAVQAGLNPTSVAVTQAGNILIGSPGAGGNAWQYAIERLTWNAGANRYDRSGYLVVGSYISDIDPQAGSNDEFYVSYGGDQQRLDLLAVNWATNAATTATLGVAADYFAPTWNNANAMSSLTVLGDNTLVTSGYFADTQVAHAGPDGTQTGGVYNAGFGGLADVAATADGALVATNCTWQPNAWDPAPNAIYFHQTNGAVAYEIALPGTGPVGAMEMAWTTVSAAALNAVANGSFRDGLSGWDWFINGGASASCVVDASTTHWENNSVKLSDASAFQGGVYGALRQTIGGLTVGKTYYVSAWCKGLNVGLCAQIAANTDWATRAGIPSGTYDWTLVQMSFSANAATVPLMFIVQDPTTALWIDDVYVTEKPMVNVNTLGITGDSSDSTDAITIALTAYKFLYFPAGTYVVHGPIHLPAGAIIWGSGPGTQIRLNSVDSTCILGAGGSDNAYVGNADIAAVKFTGTGSQQAIAAYKAANLTVHNCHAEDLTLINCTTHKSSYGAVTSDNDLSTNIRVLNNNVSHTTADYSPALGIILCYTKDSLVANNTVDGYSCGITWWGGDANTTVDGAINNPRWAKNITISQNLVTNMAAGGIWGSMGSGITVTENSISSCGDVALDVEGSKNCWLSWNAVSDGHNGALTSFFVSVDNTFCNNTVTTSDPSWPLFRLYNCTIDPSLVSNLRLANNTFTSNNGIGIIDDAMGPGYLILEGNTLNDVKIDISMSNYPGWNVAAPYIAGNIITINHDTASALNVINAYWFFGAPTVRDNIIKYLGATKTNKIGINLIKAGGSACTAIVERNNVQGCSSADIYAYYGNSGLTVNVNNNTVQYSKIKVGKRGVTTINASGNKNLNGRNVTVTTIL